MKTEQDPSVVERRLEAAIQALPDDPNTAGQLPSIRDARKKWKAQLEKALRVEYRLAQEEQRASRGLRENRFRVENYLYRLASNEWVLRAPEYPDIQKSLDRIHSWIDRFESLASAFADLRASIGSRLQALLSSITTTAEDLRRDGEDFSSKSRIEPQPTAADNDALERALSSTRKAEISAYKLAVRKQTGVRLTDAALAKSANPAWNDRTQICWYKSDDPRQSIAARRRIEKLLLEKPHLKA